jgi:hypothetical protein
MTLFRKSYRRVVREAHRRLRRWEMIERENGRRALREKAAWNKLRFVSSAQVWLQTL